MVFSSGMIGERYGYDDYWSDDRNVFHYTGEGQRGDMQWIRGNQAIRSHSEQGKRLLLFFKENRRGGLVRFEGDFEFVDFEQFKTTDVGGNSRQAFRFILKRIIENPVGAGADGGSSGEVTPGQDSPGEQKNRQYRKPDVTERTGLVISRVGQGYYRQELLEKFKGRCAVTSSRLTPILIASHIVPWRDASPAERLDVENGILLSPVYDALFDKYLISFDDTGLIQISPSLAKHVSELGVNPRAKIKVTEGMLPYLSRHRKNLKA